MIKLLRLLLQVKIYQIIIKHNKMINHHKVTLHKNNKMIMYSNLYVYKTNFHILKWNKFKILKNVTKKIIKSENLK